MRFNLASRVLAALALVLSSACTSSSQAEPTAERSGTHLTVYKTPMCTCCRGWVDHMEAEGFTATVIDTVVVSQKSQELGVPPALSSCHTSVVDDYVIEGHVPVEAVRKLLRERPDAKGLAVPGMPSGSPGMPGPREPYDVLLLRHDGGTEVYLQK